MVAEKNADELLQNFVWHTSGADIAQAKQDPNEMVPVSKDKAQADAQTGEPLFSVIPHGARC